MIFSCYILGGLSKMSPNVTEGIRRGGGHQKNSIKTVTISLLIEYLAEESVDEILV